MYFYSSTLYFDFVCVSEGEVMVMERVCEGVSESTCVSASIVSFMYI